MKKKYYGHKMFYEVLNELAEIHSRKNRDYAGDDPLSNFRMCEKAGIAAWKGIAVRLTDKICRVLHFAKREEFEVKDENVEDTLKDIAVYAILCIITYRERKNATTNVNNKFR